MNHISSVECPVSRLPKDSSILLFCYMDFSLSYHMDLNSTYRNLNLWTILVLLNVQFQDCQGRQSYVQKRILIIFRYSFRNKHIPSFPTSKLNLTTSSSMTTVNQDCPKLNQCCADLSQVDLRRKAAVPRCRVDRLIRNCAGRCQPPT